MEFENKNKRLELRLTEKEYEFLKQKAVDYDGKISRFIREAVRQYDDELGKRKFDSMRQIYKIWRENREELLRIGNNLNQAMKQINTLAAVFKIGPEDISDYLNSVIPELKNVIENHIFKMEEVIEKIEKSR